MSDKLRIEKSTDKRGGYILHAECLLPRPIDEVFEFFSDACNLEQLTPSWLKFTVLTPAPIEMQKGQLIDYRLRVRGIPLRWQSEISEWDPPYKFVDESRKGPYKFWHHQHIFESEGDNTRVIDIVHYGVPGGALIHSLFVRRDVEKIFAYRQKVLHELFPKRSVKPVIA